MKSIISIALIILLLVLTIINRSHLSKRKDFIYKNGLLTIGEVYTYSEYSRSGSTIHYKYKLGRDHASRASGPVPEWLKKGDKFLVLYLEKDPRESILLLDKPIKDSTDFQRYVKEFEEMRKQQKK